MSPRKLRPCFVCGADSHTRVSWPPMKVREHNRCETCWIQWWAFGNVLLWWYGMDYFKPKRPHTYCRECGKAVTQTATGALRVHGPRHKHCPGSGTFRFDYPMAAA